MIDRLSARIASPDRLLLPEGRASGPMPWVIAIMAFLTVLAVAAGIALAAASARLAEQMSGRATVQVVEADGSARADQSARALALLRQRPEVLRAAPVGAEEMTALLEPWLGKAGLAADLPVPALIDIDLRPGATDIAALERAVRAVAPAARIDGHARWLGPVLRLTGALGGLVALVVMLTGIATAACVVLAARAALNTHRATIDVLHLLGATDAQIARLFQRRIALDALFGGGLGLGSGLVVLVLIGGRIGALGSDLVGGAGMPGWGWLALLAVPLAAALVATVAARLTVMRALARIL